ncbi:hypothetical protein niasHT_030078 [Heterodera trifolii]|uniref:Polymerase nucleotidyl transferase domain-containing protein n=1 Tax=Heterodera trifolii TaxID=157864 RepID=A0ABD2JQY6_9BILA
MIFSSAHFVWPTDQPHEPKSQPPPGCKIVPLEKPSVKLNWRFSRGNKAAKDKSGRKRSISRKREKGGWGKASEGMPKVENEHQPILGTGTEIDRMTDGGQNERIKLKNKDNILMDKQVEVIKHLELYELLMSDGHAKLLVSGSFLLGTHTIRSDIDLLCIVPGKVIKKVHIFGNDTTLCQQMEHVCSDGTNSSLYCELCSNEFVTDLVKFPHASILLIKFIFDQMPYDVTFVIIPERKHCHQKLLTKQWTN